MPALETTVSHTLGIYEAKKRLEQFAEKLKQRFPQHAGAFTQSWNGNTLAVRGKIAMFTVNCDIHVTDASVTAKGALPILATPWKERIESTVRGELKTALG
ncbi:MAG: polyhydroxyalkanoic acid system family protein [Terracidiphilus sp.]